MLPCSFHGSCRVVIQHAGEPIHHISGQLALTEEAIQLHQLGRLQGEHLLQLGLELP